MRARRIEKREQGTGNQGSGNKGLGIGKAINHYVHQAHEMKKKEEHVVDGHEKAA
jgi:hypothetical protein